MNNRCEYVINVCRNGDTVYLCAFKHELNGHITTMFSQTFVEFDFDRGLSNHILIIQFDDHRLIIWFCQTSANHFLIVGFITQGILHVWS